MIVPISFNVCLQWPSSLFVKGNMNKLWAFYPKKTKKEKIKPYLNKGLALA